MTLQPGDPAVTTKTRTIHIVKRACNIHPYMWTMCGNIILPVEPHPQDWRHCRTCQQKAE